MKILGAVVRAIDGDGAEVKAGRPDKRAIAVAQGRDDGSWDRVWAVGIE